MTPLQSYFYELKVRGSYVLFSSFLTFFICYSFQLEILYVIGKPFLQFGHTFVFLELTEALYTMFRISTSLTFLSIVPLVLYHSWSFVVPSLYKMEREKTTGVCVLFFSLFFFEILFTYFCVLPEMCHFFLGFEMSSGGEISPVHGTPLLSLQFTARLQSYVDLVVHILWSVLILFQILPCVVVFYSTKWIHVSSFYGNRKLWGLLVLLLSAVIVPPDFVSQLVLSLFFYLLLEFFIFLGFFFD